MYLNYDKLYPTVSFSQSALVTNSNWLDSEEKVLMQLIDATGVVFGTFIPFVNSLYSITLPTTSLMANVTMNLIVMHKFCIDSI